MMRPVEGPAPHQSHSTQHPADEFGSRNIEQEQKGYWRGFFSSLKLFQLLMETWRCCFGRCIVWLGLLAVVRLFFLWACSIPFWSSLSIMVLMVCFFHKLSLISVEFSFFLRPFGNTLTSTDVARLPWWPLHEKAVHLFLHLVSYLLTDNSEEDIHIHSMTA